MSERWIVPFAQILAHFALVFAADAQCACSGQITPDYREVQRSDYGAHCRSWDAPDEKPWCRVARGACGEQTFKSGENTFWSHVPCESGDKTQVFVPASDSEDHRGANSGSANSAIDIGFLSTTEAHYLTQVKGFMRAACKHTPGKINVHVLTDIDDARSIVGSGSCWSAQIHDLRRLSPPLQARFAALRSGVEEHSWSMNNYNFMYKVMAQFILPPAVQRIIIMDLDMLVLADLRQLWAHFDRFGPQQMIGMAPEMQPTYYPCGKTDELMKLWPKSRTGYTAYNGGLQLLDLGKMRLNSEYNKITSKEQYGVWTDTHREPWSGGHCTSNGGNWDLGDQDFYALLAVERPQWFYTLSCRWNVQLCVFWQERHNMWPPEYPEFGCSEPPAILHGNGKTSEMWSPGYKTPSCATVREALAKVRKKHVGIFQAVEDNFCSGQNQLLRGTLH